MNDENSEVPHPPDWTKQQIEEFEKGVHDLQHKNPGLTGAFDQEGKIRAGVKRFVRAFEEIRNLAVPNKEGLTSGGAPIPEHAYILLPELLFGDPIRKDDDVNIGGPGKGEAFLQFQRQVFRLATDGEAMQGFIQEKESFLKASAWRVVYHAHLKAVASGAPPEPAPKLEEFQAPHLTPRLVLESLGFAEEEIQEYFKRTGTTE